MLSGEEQAKTAYGRLAELLANSNRGSIIAREDFSLTKTTAVPRSLFKFLPYFQGGDGSSRDAEEDTRSSEEPTQSLFPSVQELNTLMQTVGFISDMLPSIHRNEAELIVKLIPEYVVVAGVDIILVTPDNQGSPCSAPEDENTRSTQDDGSDMKTLGAAGYGGAFRLNSNSPPPEIPNTLARRPHERGKAPPLPANSELQARCRASISFPLLTNDGSPTTNGAIPKPHYYRHKRSMETLKNNKVVRRVRDMFTISGPTDQRQPAKQQHNEEARLPRRSPTAVSGHSYKGTLGTRKLSTVILKAIYDKTFTSAGKNSYRKNSSKFQNSWMVRA